MGIMYYCCLPGHTIGSWFRALHHPLSPGLATLVHSHFAQPLVCEPIKRDDSLVQTLSYPLRDHKMVSRLSHSLDRLRDRNQTLNKTLAGAVYSHWFHCPGRETPWKYHLLLLKLHDCIFIAWYRAEAGLTPPYPI